MTHNINDSHSIGRRSKDDSIQAGLPPKRGCLSSHNAISNVNTARHYNLRSSTSIPILTTKRDKTQKYTGVCINSQSTTSGDVSIPLVSQPTTSRDVSTQSNLQRNSDYSSIPLEKELTKEGDIEKDSSKEEEAQQRTVTADDDATVCSESPTYDFLSTKETPPSDGCRNRSIFEAQLNESADDYIRNRDATFKRRCQLDLFYGTLAALNVDEEYSTADYVNEIENQISSFGITEIEFKKTNSTIVAQADDVFRTSIEFEIPEKEEVLIVNGCVAPTCGSDNLGKKLIPLHVEEFSTSDCSLCSVPTTNLGR